MVTLKRVLSVGMILGVAFFLLASDLRGQGLTWMGINLWDSVTAARSKIGPVRINASLNVTNTGYDSNIYPGQAEEPVPDATVSIGTNLNIFLPIRNKVVFDIVGSPYYTYFFETERERGLNNILRGQVHLLLKRIYMAFGGGLANIRQRVSTEVNYPVRTKQNEAHGSILWQAGRWTSFLIKFNWTKFAFSDTPLGEPNFLRRLNRQQNIIGLTTYAQTSSKIRLRLDGEYASYIFDELPEIRNSRSYILSCGFDFLESSRVQGTANLGLRYFDSLNPEGIDHTGLYGNILLDWNLTERWALRGSFQRGPQFSAWSDFLYYIQTSFGSGINYQASRRTRFGYDFFWGQNIYPSHEPGVVDRRSDRYLTHSGRIDFQLARHLNLSLIASLSIRRLTLAFLPYDRTFIGFDLTYDF